MVVYVGPSGVVPFSLFGPMCGVFSPKSETPTLDQTPKGSM